MTENMTMRCYINLTFYGRQHFYKNEETKTKEKTYFRFQKLNRQSYVVRCVSNKIKYKCFGTRETIFTEILCRSIFEILNKFYKMLRSHSPFRKINKPYPMIAHIRIESHHNQ